MRRVIDIILFLLLFYFLPNLPLIAAGKRVVIDSLKINSGRLTVEFHAEGLIDDKIVTGLEKGLTSTIEYQIQLWRKKLLGFNQLLEEKLYRIKLFYDTWDNRFVLLSPEETRMTSSAKTVIQSCGEIRELELVPLNRLTLEATYFVSIKVVLKPLSMENYKEISNWLKGEVKNIDLNPENTETGVKGRLLRIFLALTGFGDRVFSGQSPDFVITEKGEIVWKL